VKTFSREAWTDAQAAWDDGEFSDEWREVRHTMAMQGCIFPPSGTKWDSWEDDAPTQRAILIRAIRETPDLLRASIAGASSWHQVIDRLTHRLNDWRAEMRADEGPDDDRPVDRDAPMRIAHILARIADSVAS
jgi:hypothetical protein